MLGYGGRQLPQPYSGDASAQLARLPMDARGANPMIRAVLPLACFARDDSVRFFLRGVHPTAGSVGLGVARLAGVTARRTALHREAGLDEEVQLEVQGNAVVIRPLASTRAGWAAAAVELAATREGLLDAVRPTAFDQDKWAW